MDRSRSARFRCRYVPLFAAIVCCTGCQTLSGESRPWPGDPVTAESPGGIQQTSGREAAGSGIAQAGSTEFTESDDAEPSDTTESLIDSAQSSARSIAGFLTGKEPTDQERARSLYREADAIFRRASSLPQEESEDAFADAAKRFEAASEAAPGSALGQDAMFMQAESEFFSHQLNDAAESYQKLQKEYPRNRHSDRAAARLFVISRYWIDINRVEGGSWIPNLTDEKRPLLESDKHAIRILDQIRFDDPTGKLADDATMAAAAEHISQGRFQEADEFLTDLRQTYTDSQHLFLAHMLGIQCKLELYAGPRYSNLLLDEAEELVEQTRRRFPDRLQEEKYSEVLARASAKIDYHKANKLMVRARWNEKQRQYRAASVYYRKLRDQHAGTEFAKIAEERLAEISDLPPVPTPALAFLKKVFRDRNNKPPLELASSAAPGEGSAPADGSVTR